MGKMRSRSNSGVRLDYYQRIIGKTIVQYQDPVTGLVPSVPGVDHGWVRDNVYSVLAMWGLSLAYKKNADLDEDRAKAYELEQSCVKLMRGLLMAMMYQKDKVEKFKETLSPSDALHAKYSTTTGRPVVGDDEWGHLQVDATSLFLLILAQMTASGLQIVFDLDEVALVQNLIFYIESAYCVPDYGIWERGDKTNHGLSELNASSIGMAKAALEAMNELDLFGARGGPASVIRVLADEAQKCQAVLQSMLPRESNSKEVDAALLCIISFPAFAVDDVELIRSTRSTIVEKLQGKYGCKRFLRDGHQTAKEDKNRLYYEPWELKVFENIECEWPLFFCYLILDGCFSGDTKMLEFYEEALDKIIVKSEDGLRLVPEFYVVPPDKVNAEYLKPHSQERAVGGKVPFIWAQSLYVLGRLLREGFLAPGELDPLNRRLCSEEKPDVVVQVVVLAEDDRMKEMLKAFDIDVQTTTEVAPIEVQPARVLSHIYTYLGRNRKLNLSGRKSRDVGILSTSKLYTLRDKIFAFTPQFVDRQRYYIASDTELLLDVFKSEMSFLKSSWHMLGRPMVIFPVNHTLLGHNLDVTNFYTVTDVDLLVYIFKSAMSFLKEHWRMLGRPTVTIVMDSIILDEGRIPAAVISTMKKLKSGYIGGARVSLGKLDDFLNTSCITDLSFLGNQEDGCPDMLHSHIQQYLEKELHKSLSSSQSKANKVSTNRALSDSSRIWLRGQRDHTGDAGGDLAPISRRRKSSVAGMIKRSRTILLHDDEVSTDGHQSIKRVSSNLPPILDSSEDNPTSPLENRSRSPSPEAVDGDDDWMPRSKLRGQSIHYENVDIGELLNTLRETDNLEEHGDILHYFVNSRGVDWDTGLGSTTGTKITVKDLLKTLYDKACQQKNWALVRHIAGILGKKVADLAKAVTDLLVRQKQITVGLPPYGERTITRPLPVAELRSLIHLAYGEDESTAMLTQELIVYLAMFIRTEPHLFEEMLRLRVGLIIQVMASELKNSLKCRGGIASEHLLNLSPFEMKNLLHHLLSGKEFGVRSARSGTLSVVSSKSSKISKQKAPQQPKRSQLGKTISGNLLRDGHAPTDDDKDMTTRQGHWLRRRRLDGALNRVPLGFYPKVWRLLEKTYGLQIAGKVIPQTLTQEMTPGELKFALQMETVLNTIPQPEYRQLVVEVIMVLSLIIEYDVVKHTGSVIAVEDIVHKANQIFLDDQRQVKGDSTLCCVPLVGPRGSCNAAYGICQHFYDSAPSGIYGTMTYMIRSAVTLLDCLPKDGEIDCAIS